ncbi:hypothetical protein OsJ_15410 [Oryza sativa Japonica Group]|uniref:Uncharacterized protein n=1 Tax=Oryza sativa subsp. japonica TaxID=39947 RepID=B9FG26_ORYSJ|nr:hypothetical protein OsJ_15410 [Oryza sativa Japonica Group]
MARAVASGSSGGGGGQPFDPTAEDIVNRYLPLRRALRCDALPRQVHDADVYGAHPALLASVYPAANEREDDEEARRASRRTEWWMDEYRFGPDFPYGELPAPMARGEDEELVVYKVYPRLGIVWSYAVSTFIASLQHVFRSHVCSRQKDYNRQLISANCYHKDDIIDVQGVSHGHRIAITRY